MRTLALVGSFKKYGVNRVNVEETEVIELGTEWVFSPLSFSAKPALFIRHEFAPIAPLANHSAGKKSLALDASKKNEKDAFFSCYHSNALFGL